jgi:hypothetical protein
MNRHVSDETLARYSGDDLNPRKAGKIASHLGDCPSCEQRLSQLEAVPNMLASVQFSGIPDHLSSRIQLALASESSARAASEPGTEAGRRDLPSRARPPRRGGWLPRLTSPVGLRVAAATGAAVVLAGGGYEIAAHTGSGAGTSSEQINTPESGAAAGHASSLRFGPAVAYRQSGHTHSIKSVQSATNFRAATLVRQVQATLAAQRVTNSGREIQEPNSEQQLGSTSAASPSPGPTGTSSLTKLRGCVDRIAAGRSVLLVDIAKYEGRPATIIVVQPPSSSKAQVYAVGAGCASGASDILASQVLPR